MSEIAELRAELQALKTRLSAWESTLARLVQSVENLTVQLRQYKQEPRRTHYPAIHLQEQHR